MAGAISAGAANRAAGGKQVGNDREKSKATEGGGVGAGTKSLMAGTGTKSYAQAPGSAMAADKSWKADGNHVVDGRAVRGESGPGGGTTTTTTYSPGAVGNFPDANAAAVADMLSSAIPGMGLTNTAYKGAKALDGSDPLSASTMGPLGDAFGGDPGPQRGFQPDRFKGKANLEGVGDPGSASGETREIAGRSYGAGTQALLGDSEDAIDTGTGGPADDFSDVTLKDRRKPYLGAGTRMALAL